MINEQTRGMRWAGPEVFSIRWLCKGVRCILLRHGAPIRCDNNLVRHRVALLSIFRRNGKPSLGALLGANGCSRKNWLIISFLIHKFSAKERNLNINRAQRKCWLMNANMYCERYEVSREPWRWCKMNLWIFFSGALEWHSLEWWIYGNNKLMKLLLLFATINNTMLIEHVCHVARGAMYLSNSTHLWWKIIFDVFIQVNVGCFHLQLKGKFIAG